MSLFNLHYRDKLQSKNSTIMHSAVLDELEDLASGVSEWALTEHNEDGTHNVGASGFGFVPIGGMIRWATSVPPTHWLNCDGTAVSRTSYPLLFKAIGIAAGAGDGVNTFNLPTVANFIILAG